MQLSKMKNIIVLKGMSSNVVDEAIVVLKPNVKLKQSEFNSKRSINSEDKKRKMIVVKEAENTINNYIRKIQNESTQCRDKKLLRKYKFLQIFNTILIFSIIITTIILV